MRTRALPELSIAVHFLPARNCARGIVKAKPPAQSEPDLTLAVADRGEKRGIAANGLTERKAFNNAPVREQRRPRFGNTDYCFCTPSGSKSSRPRRKMQK